MDPNFLTDAAAHLGAFTLLAQTGPAAPASGAAASAPADNPLQIVIPFIVAIFAIYWLMVGRHQKGDQRRRQELLDGLAKGDHVITAGGVHGTIEAIDVTKGTVSLTIAPKTTITVSKTYLHTITPKKRPGQDKDEKKEEKKEEAPAK